MFSTHLFSSPDELHQHLGVVWQGAILRQTGHQTGPELAVSLAGQKAMFQLLTAAASSPFEESASSFAEILSFDKPPTTW